VISHCGTKVRQGKFPGLGYFKLKTIDLLGYLSDISLDVNGWIVE
jgi:hypothetical protein